MSSVLVLIQTSLADESPAARKLISVHVFDLRTNLKCLFGSGSFRDCHSQVSLLFYVDASVLRHTRSMYRNVCIASLATRNLSDV